VVRDAYHALLVDKARDFGRRTEVLSAAMRSWLWHTLRANGRT